MIQKELQHPQLGCGGRDVHACVALQVSGLDVFPFVQVGLDAINVSLRACLHEEQALQM